MSRKQIAGWIGAVLLWLILMYFQLYEFSYPNMDSWCYFAPAAFAQHTFGLSTPLLGDFHGAASTWGLNWPGGELIASLFTPFIHGSSRIYVGWFCLQWLVVGFGTAYLIQKLTLNRFLAVLGAGLILTDRTLFSVAWLQRHELLAGGILLGLVILSPWGSQRELRGKSWCFWALGFFVLPCLQPACGPAGLCFSVLLLLVSVVTRQRWRESVVASGSFTLGVLGVFAYFHFQPAAWAFFRDHASMGVEISRQKPFFPPAQWANIWEYYSRAPTGILFYGAGIVAAVRFIWQGLRDHRTWLEDQNRFQLFLVSSLFLVLFAACHRTYNGYYLALVFPFVVILSTVQLAQIFNFFQTSRLMQLAVVVGLIGIHSLFLDYRAYVLARAGFPRIREELKKTAQLLPASRRLLIPEVLWENYIDASRHVRMNTLPYNASESLRELYEGEVYRDLRRGDILIIDQVQAQPPRYRIRSEEWEEIAHYRCGYISSKFRGFDLTVFRRK
jgi:hypothetical protein